MAILLSVYFAVCFSMHLSVRETALQHKIWNLGVVMGTNKIRHFQ